MKIGELFVELGFHADTIKLNEFAQLLGRLNLSSVLASFGVKELYDGLKDIMSIGERTAMGMNLFGKETGLSAQKMTQWTKYAEQMGVSGDAVSSALTTLQKKSAGLKSGLDSSLLTPLYMLNQAGSGITNADLDNPFVFLEKAIKGLQKVNPELKTTIAGMLGINEQLLAIKSFGDANLLPAISPEQVNALLKYHKVWTDLSQTISMFFTNLASEYAPDLQSFGEALVGMGKNISQNVVEFRAWFEVLTGFAALFVPFLRLPYVLYMIATHFREISDAAKSAWEWVDKIAHAYAPANVGASLRQGFDNFVGGGNSSSSSKQISQTNTFHITSNNPQEVGKKVHDVIRDLLSDAQYQQPLTSR